MKMKGTGMRIEVAVLALGAGRLAGGLWPRSSAPPFRYLPGSPGGARLRRRAEPHPRSVRAGRGDRADRNARLFLLACVVLTVGFAGCASISQLTVAPTTVCPGENVHVSWRTCGTTTLTQVPIRPGQSDECVDSLPVGASPVPVSSSGTVERQASGDTVFYVEAKGWLGKPSHKCVRVFVNEVLPLAGIPQCAGPRAIRVVVSRPAGSSWSGRTTVGVVQNLNDIPVSVRHGGRVATLAPRETSGAFSTMDPGGDWIIESDLQDGPDCGQAGTRVPTALSLQVNPLCQR